MKWKLREKEQCIIVLRKIDINLRKSNLERVADINGKKYLVIKYLNKNTINK